MAIWPFNKSQWGPGGARRTSPDNPPHARCSFCGKPRALAGPMVEGPNDVYMCVECVRLAHEIAEGNRMQPVATDLATPGVRRSAHMHVRLYFFLEPAPDGTWRATSQSPEGYSANGASAREAAMALQALVLREAADAFASGRDVGEHFTNHADERLR